jgi:uncharacterized cupin superfamily protein
MSVPQTVSIDRSLVVSREYVVKTRFVSVSQIDLMCTDRMSVGDVAQAYQKALQMGECGSWPPPVGYWSKTDGRFKLTDGRHEFVARLMLGHRELFVAWVAKDESSTNQ